MKDTKQIDRRSLLTSSVSVLGAAILGGCGDDSGSGGTHPSGAPVNDGGASLNDAAASNEDGGFGDGGGVSDGGLGAGGADAGGGTGDAGAGGLADAGGTCVSVVAVVNSHTHVLVVPLSDVERGYSDSTYLLEDGGAGHTHSLYLSAYDFLYLQGGTVVTFTSSTDSGHEHNCTLTCGGG